jgi:uncharacterized protein (DUF2164 family)
VAIEVPKEARKILIASIRRYFDEKLEQEMGELQAGLLLDYFLAEIAPTVYNLAIRDAQAYFMEKATDLEGTCFAPEMEFWKRRPRA